MTWQQRIIIDPAILVGKPVVKGTPLAVKSIVELFAEGWSEQDILDNYPGLTGEDIKACLSYDRDCGSQRESIGGSYGYGGSAC